MKTGFGECFAVGFTVILTTIMPAWANSDAASSIIHEAGQTPAEAESALAVVAEPQVGIPDDGVAPLLPKVSIGAGFGSELRQIELISDDDLFSLLTTHTEDSAFFETSGVTPLRLPNRFLAKPTQVIVFGQHTANLSEQVADQSAFGIKIDASLVSIGEQTRLSWGTVWQRRVRDARPIRDISSVHTELTWTLRPDIAFEGRITGSYLDVHTSQPNRSAIQVQVSANYSASADRNFTFLLKSSKDVSSVAHHQRSLQLAMLEGRWNCPEGWGLSYLGFSGTFIHSDYEAADPRWEAVRRDRQISAELEVGRQLDAFNDLRLMIAARNRKSSIPVLQRRSSRVELSLSHKF